MALTWVLWALLIQNRQRPNVSVDLPVCANIAFSVEVVDPRAYLFRMSLRDEAAAPVALGERSGLSWDVEFKTSQGWKSVGTGFQATVWDDREFVPAKVQTKIFEGAGIWGDEASPHPGGNYRIVFRYENRVASPAGGIRRICAVQANPVILTEPRPENRR